MKSQKIGALFIISILALTGIGISYAGLTDSIYIFGTAKTAVVEFMDITYSGTHVWKMFDQDINEYGYEITVTNDLEWAPSPDEGELISWAKACDPTEEPAIIPGGVFDGKEYEIFVDCYNLIPQIPYVADIHFTIGSIPVKIEDISYEIIAGNEWILPLINGDIPGGQFEATMRVIRDGQEIEVTEMTQLHPGEEVIIKLYILIPQNNAYQGLFGSFAAHISIIQWTDPCSDPHKQILVPVNLDVRLRYPDPGNFNGEGLTYWDCEFTTVPAGTWSPPIALGNHARCWCVDNTAMSSNDLTLSVVTKKSTDPDILTIWPGNDDNTPDGYGGITPWDCVNYIINHDDGKSVNGIQNAIWYYIDGGVYPGGISSSVQLINMVNDSYDDGTLMDWLNEFPKTDTGYNMIAVMLIPVVDWNDGQQISEDHSEQLVIIEVDP